MELVVGQFDTLTLVVHLGLHLFDLGLQLLQLQLVRAAVQRRHHVILGQMIAFDRLEAGHAAGQAAADRDLVGHHAGVIAADVRLLVVDPATDPDDGGDGHHDDDGQFQPA